MAIPIAVAAGALAASQAFISGELAKATDSLWAGLISNIGAFLAVLFFLFSKTFRQTLTTFFQKLQKKEIPIWMLFGGAFGAIYVATSAYAVASLGAGLFTIGVVASANFTSLIMDRFGFGSLQRYRINIIRLFSALLALIAVAVAVYNPEEKLFLFPLFIVALAGIAQIFQLAFNSKLATITSTKIATFINFPVSILVGTIFLISFIILNNSIPDFPRTWWLYSGGLLGASFVLIAAWLVRILGVLVFTLATISGQLVSALFLDYLFLGIDLGWQIFSGAFLVLLAAYFARGVR